MQERKIVMTKAELRYLMAIDMLYDGISGVKLTEIAAEMAVTKVSVYRAMERLEGNGYIERNEKNKDYNACVLFGVYSDMEIAFKQIGDFENAYRYASKKLSLISAFKE